MTNDKPQFTRTPGGLSVRAVIKAADVKRTPEYAAKRHGVGLLMALVEMYPREAVEAVRVLVIDGGKKDLQA